MGLFDAFRQYLRDAAPGGALNPEVTPQGILDATAMATMPVPVLGDIAGLAADSYMFATDPSSRTPGNYALAGAGLLPFVPSMGMLGATKWFHGTSVPEDSFKVMDEGIWLSKDAGYADWIGSFSTKHPYVHEFETTAKLKKIDLLEEGKKLAKLENLPEPKTMREAQELVAGDSWNEVVYDLADNALKEGFDGVEIKNFNDNWIGPDIATTMAYLPAESAHKANLIKRSASDIKENPWADYLKERRLVEKNGRLFNQYGMEINKTPVENDFKVNWRSKF